MDILKILSRGTKLPKKSNDAVKIPSAGVAVHPQLFHDPVASATSSSKFRKRKREKRDVEGETGPSRETEDDDLGDLDFFALAQKPEHGKTNGVAPAETKPPPETETNSKLLDEDECRTILRSHRLKFTVLSHVKAAESAVKKSKDKSKKKKSTKSEDPGPEADGAQSKKQQQVYPQPLTAFSQLRQLYEISPRLADNLDKLHYRVPTEVQMASLPLLLNAEVALQETAQKEEENGEVAETEDMGASGVDLLAVAPTGSGKTLAFLVPAINSVLKRRREMEEEGQTDGHQIHDLAAVVVAPTRELAMQIADEGKKLALGTGVRVVLMRKGMRVMAASRKVDGDAEDEEFASEDEDGDQDEYDSEDESTTGATKPRKRTKDHNSVPTTKTDILVTTPMLLLNFLTPGKQTLPSVRSLILDEADVLLDTLFRDQTLGIWSACTSPHLRISFWSATMGPNIETLIAQNLNTARNITSSSTPSLIRLVVGLKDTAVPNITHKLIYTSTEAGKLLGLRQLLHPSSSTTKTTNSLRPPFIIFTQTISRATALRSELHYDIPLPAGGGASRVAALHSNLPASQRADIVRRFRAGEVWVLVTTDVAARGLDFRGVNGVVNYDVPASSAAYVHRAGRTCRAGREGGTVVTFYTKDDIPFVRSVVNVIKASEVQQGGVKEGGGVQDWLLNALPAVSKEDRKKMKRAGGIEERRDGTGKRARVTSRAGFDKRKENNRKGAIAASKRRKFEGEKEDASDGSEWGGLD